MEDPNINFIKKNGLFPATCSECLKVRYLKIASYSDICRSCSTKKWKAKKAMNSSR
jgi:hypothetical protein